MALNFSVSSRSSSKSRNWRDPCTPHVARLEQNLQYKTQISCKRGQALITVNGVAFSRTDRRRETSELRRIVLRHHELCYQIGAQTELGKNSTLRISASSKPPESSFFNVPALLPNIVSGQVDVLPARVPQQIFLRQHAQDVPPQA